MVQVPLNEAAARLPALIRNAKAGEEILLLDNELPIARVIPLLKVRPAAQFGSAKGLIELSEDFDETPEGLNRTCHEAIAQRKII